MHNPQYNKLVFLTPPLQEMKLPQPLNACSSGCALSELDGPREIPMDGWMGSNLGKSSVLELNDILMMLMYLERNLTAAIGDS